MTRRVAAYLLILTTLSLSAASAQPRRELPYWASISSGEALTRAGPGRNYPGQWLYVRRDLPVRVVAVHESWRKIEDPDGTQGWMLFRLLSDERTALVRGDEPEAMREQADEGSPVRFRAAPGVVGRITDCASGWCRFDVGGRAGFIRTENLWGVDANENMD